MTHSFNVALLDRDAAKTLIEGFRKPTQVALAKSLDHLDVHMRRYVEAAPFCCLSSADAEGHQDVSPRGDPRGSFKVLDARTIAIADRPGNNRIDTLRNLLENPNIGLLFLRPGLDETVRVNGTAGLSVDPHLLELLAVNGVAPRLAIVVHVEAAYLHCAKAFRRSRLWDPAAFESRDAMPSLARIIADQMNLTDADQDALDERTERAYRDGLWAPIP